MPVMPVMPKFEQKEEPLPKINGLKINRGCKKRGYVITIYGMPGIGKTTWANKAELPIIADIDKGCAHINCTSVESNSWNDLQNIVKWFKTQVDFQTLIIDTIDKLEPQLWRHVCLDRKEPWKSIESPGYGKGYAEAVEYWTKFLDEIKAIADSGKNIIFTSHNMIKSYSSPDSEAYDRYQLAIHHKAADQFFNSMDAVIFCQYEQFVQKNKSGEFVGSTTKERIAICGESITAQCKNRFGMPEKLPFDEDLFRWLKF
jgi:hypothetical protein